MHQGTRRLEIRQYMQLIIIIFILGSSCISSQSTVNCWRLIEECLKDEQGGSTMCHLGGFIDSAQRLNKIPLSGLLNHQKFIFS